MNVWETRFFRRPDDEGAGGGASPEAGGEGGEGADAGLLGVGAAAAGTETDGAGEGAADPKVEKGEVAEAYRPDGVADNLIGKTDQETIDAMAKAIKGFQKDASRKGVPSDEAGYKIDVDGDDDEIGAGLNSEHMAPVVDRARAAALKAGLGADQFAAFVREFAGADGDMTWMLPDDAAAQINGKAEFERLVEDVKGEAQAKAVFQQITSHWNMLAKAGVFDSEISAAPPEPGSDAYEFGLMIGTAHSARIMSKILSAFTQKDPIPYVAPSGGQTSEAFMERQSEILAMPQGEDRDAAYAAFLTEFDGFLGSA